MSSTQTLLNVDSLRPQLERCGYTRENVVTNLSLGGGKTAAWAGFSQRPFDSRSACIVAIDAAVFPAQEAAACRDTGAPVALVCWQNELFWWKQGEDGPSEYLRISAHELDGFFREHGHDLAPQTIYRAKTLGRFEATYQRDFVDLGLMPMVEKEAGIKIEGLLIDQVVALRDALHWPKDLNVEQGQWLVKAVFWLLGAKMLHDKSVEGFIRLDFGDVGQVFERVARHYGQSAEAIITSERKRKALQIASDAIAQRADLRLASTEALAFVYENTLISKEVRKGLGTHSTPAYLIDYIVGRLAPWIEAMSQGERTVFEPACGHGGFLVAAVRLLTSLLSPAEAVPAQRRNYLRQRIQGYDIDPFALEIARLSLTLTDIPNPNGWNLKQGDAFTSEHLETAAAVSRILLANPPFEKLEPTQRDRYTKQFRAPQFLNKAAEMLCRSISALPEGGVFGVVVPQNLLHSKDATDFRQMLVKHTEFEEICLFPDKVFNFADVESAILLGRKVAPADFRSPIRYRRVRENEMDVFRATYEATSEIVVGMSRFGDSETYDFRVPDLEEIWAACAHLPKLEDFVEIGQGFSFVGKDRPNFPHGQQRTSSVPLPGFVEGFENLGDNVMTHKLPPTVYLNVNPEIVRVAILGTTVGIPQVLANEAPVQRGPWCVKAMMDQVGRAATSSFTIYRWRKDALPLAALWALLCSPIASAFAFSHSSKWHIITGTWRNFRVPAEFEAIATDRNSTLSKAVESYLAAVDSFETTFKLSSEDFAEKEALKWLHWRIDAEILKLYSLPSELERKLLDYFSNCKRVGVPFFQDRYFPAGFKAPLSLADYLAITEDWEITNERRLKLIQRKLAGNLVQKEKEELKNLKRLASAKSDLVMPLPNEDLAKREADLRRRGKWLGE